MTKKSIFEKTEALWPDEYPHLDKYHKAIRNSYWDPDEYNFVQDIQDFKVNLSSPTRTAVKRTMLAIAQIEVKVKLFWGSIHDRFPKPVIGNVGATFSESEVRHQLAYKRLLKELGLMKDFENLLEVPQIKGRIAYLNKYLDGVKSRDNRTYTKSLMLFSLFVEHVSLFSQFLIMLSVHKEENLLSGFSNVVDSTMQEENLHGMFGSELVNIIREENPDWFDEDLNNSIYTACRKALKAESELLDWIFEEGELSYLPKIEIIEFLKNRFNLVLVDSGFEKVFETDDNLLESTEWLEVQLKASKEGDFFYKRNTDYSKFTEPMTADDLY